MENEVIVSDKLSIMEESAVGLEIKGYKY